MVGISSYGAYVPRYRLNRDEIARANGSRSIGGERAVANYDEDSITMAVAAGMNCLEGFDRGTVDALFFASTTPPYKEKQSASVVATALDLNRDVRVSDFGNSLNAGTNALNAAVASVKSGDARQVLVVVADCRIGKPGSAFEMNIGDGAAALLIGSENVAVTIDCRHSHADDFMGHWRDQGDTFIQSWEERFVIEHGYNKNLMEAVAGLMADCGLKPQDFAKAAYYSPDARTHLAIGRAMGLDPKTQIQNALYDKMGNTGAAFALMLLVAALEDAEPGQKLLLAGYGDGADAFSLSTTENIEGIKGRKAIKYHLDQRAGLPSYESYQRFRRLMSSEVTRAPSVAMFVPVVWRDRAQTISLRGQRCHTCGEIEFPQQRICGFCQSKDNFEEVRLSDKNGAVFTYTIDYMTPSLNPPTVRCAVDFEGGGRMLVGMTDCDSEGVAIDMPIEMTFRKLFDTDELGLHTYFWKCKPQSQ